MAFIIMYFKVNQWLEYPSVNDGGRGMESAKAMISQAKK